MAAQYVNVERYELEALLPGDKGWSGFTMGTELVFAVTLPATPTRWIDVRVYTGMDRNGQSRECGADAMRVVVWDHDHHKPLLRKLSRVHRTQGWPRNLGNRVVDAMQAAYTVLKLPVQAATVAAAKQGLVAAGEDRVRFARQQQKGSAA